MSDTAESMQKTMDIELPNGMSITIQKLKAGKYYEAQKVYTDWLKELSGLGLFKLEKDAENLEELMDVDVKKKNDMERADKIFNSSASFSDKKLQIISICLGSQIEKVKDDYYPEDLDVIFKACVTLNDFMGNLTKSVAPTAGIGA